MNIRLPSWAAANLEIGDARRKGGFIELEGRVSGVLHSQCLETACAGRMRPRGRDIAGENGNDTLPNSSPTRLRSGAVIVADEQSKAADAVKWPRPQDLAGLGKIADQIIGAGYHCVGDLRGR